jgi:hypothetical protein
MVQCIVHAVVGGGGGEGDGCSYRLHDNLHPWDRKAAGHGMIKTTDLKLVPPSPLIHKYAA